jgi:hypothetical protein
LHCRRTLLLITCIAAVGLVITPAAAKPQRVWIKGKLRTDGALTVRQLETVTVRGLPPRMNLDLSIAPLDDLTNCYDIGPGTCLPTPLHPAPGSPGFRTSSKGQAVLTFVMPDSYPLISSGFGPDDEGPQQYVRSFRDGQVVTIRARGSKRHVVHGSRTLTRGSAFGQAVVEVPPPPAP